MYLLTIVVVCLSFAAVNGSDAYLGRASAPATYPGAITHVTFQRKYREDPSVVDGIRCRVWERYCAIKINNARESFALGFSGSLTAFARRECPGVQLEIYHNDTFYAGFPLAMNKETNFMSGTYLRAARFTDLAMFSVRVSVEDEKKCDGTTLGFAQGLGEFIFRAVQVSGDLTPPESNDNVSTLVCNYLGCVPTPMRKRPFVPMTV